LRVRIADTASGLGWADRARDYLVLDAWSTESGATLVLLTDDGLPAAVDVREVEIRRAPTASAVASD
jgi:hypothetical protein